MAPSNPATITPPELEARLAAGEDLLLLDVREPTEWAICRIEGSRLVPLGELSARVAELDRARPTVCICHHGIRSGHAAAALARLDFGTVYNLAGGIDRWAREVDSSMPRY